MKYEFHVGDYVETKDGWIGYVDRVDSIDNSLYIYFDKNTGHEYTADGLLSTFSVFLARKKKQTLG